MTSFVMSMPSPSTSTMKRKASGVLSPNGHGLSHLRNASSSADSLQSDSPEHGDRAMQGDGSESSSAAAAAFAAAQATKRIKTARACDSCRRKKIRCDVVDDGGPILGDPNNGNGGLTCAHCRQYGFDCTFFLPITETRFKKKREREAEEMAAVVAAAGGHPNHVRSLFPPPHMQGSRSIMPGITPYAHSASMNDMRFASQMPYSIQPGQPSSARNALLESPSVTISSTQDWPRPNDDTMRQAMSGLPSSFDHQNLRSQSAIFSPSELPRAQPEASKKRRGSHEPASNDTRVLGPTSIAYIVHSTAFVPGAAIEEHDLKHHQTFEVGASGNGIIKFHKPPRGNSFSNEDSDEQELAKIPESIRGRLAGDVAEKLVNTYFERIGHLFPVITKSEFLHLSPPPPLLLYAICGVAALNREVPKEVLTAIRVTLNGLFRNMDLMSNSNITTVQALLIMSLHSDMHAPTAVQSGSRCWNRAGAAIRMAQDLGLHRDASGRVDSSDHDAYFLEQKRRIWGCCVTADRCMSISLGHPLAIDLTDCDVRLPSAHEVLRFPEDLPSRPGEDRPFAFNTEMLKLTILFGRVMKTIYSPTGLMKTTDEEILGLLNDIDRWRNNLPVALQFHGARDTQATGGILHVSYACLMHLFFRVFMRISYNCPQHLNFSLTIERMTNLIRYSREAIEWVNCNEYYMDTMQFVSYGVVFCATVQYHAFVRRGDQQALGTLKLARDCVQRYKRQGEVEAEDLTMRAKSAQVVKLLHESALGAYATTPNSGNLNPTAGVTNRRTRETVKDIVFKPDDTRPGGGVYVAANTNMLLDDLPSGTIILQETEAGHIPALVRTHADEGSSWKPYGFSAGNSHNANGALQFNNIGDINGPALSDLKHVAGGVWADSEGRPVDAQGSRLLTMIPVPNGGAMLQQQQNNFSNNQVNGNNQSFDTSNNTYGDATTGDHGDHDQNHRTDSNNQPLNDAAWLSAMAAQASSEGVTLPSTFNFSDIYTFDGQVAHPAQNLNTQTSVAASMPSRLSLSNGISSTSGSSENSTPTFAFAARASAPSQGASSLSTESGISMAPGAFSGSQSIDPLALDGMPGGALDFVAWDQWFRGTTSSVNNNSNMGS